MNIFLAPVYALFSLDFYRLVMKSSIGKGFLYLLYLTGLAMIALMIFFVGTVMPQMDEFAAWTQTQMPSLTWTPAGLTMDRPGPYAITHPEMGPLMLFDMEAKDVTVQSMGEMPILVTSTRIYTRRGEGELRTFDITQPAEGTEPAPQNFEINGDSVGLLYKTVKPWLLIIVIFGFGIFFYLWKIASALFYSLIGMIFNQMRKSKLDYATILNICFYAITASTLFQILQMLIPLLGRVPFGLLGSFIVTSVYVFFAVKKTETDVLPNTSAM